MNNHSVSLDTHRTTEFSPCSLAIWNQSLTRSWPLDRRGYFEQGMKWDAPLGVTMALAFGGFTL